MGNKRKNKKEIKNEVLDSLDFDELSVSEISKKIGSNWLTAWKYCEELRKEGKIVITPEQNATVYRKIGSLVEKCSQCNAKITEEMKDNQEVVYSYASHTISAELIDEMHNEVFCSRKCYNKFLRKGLRIDEEQSLRLIEFLQEHIESIRKDKKLMSVLNIAKRQFKK